MFETRRRARAKALSRLARDWIHVLAEAALGLAAVIALSLHSLPPASPEEAAARSAAHAFEAAAAAGEAPMTPDAPGAAALEAAALASIMGSMQGPDRAREVRVGRGDTLVSTLERAGVAREARNNAVYALAEMFDPRDLRAGQRLTLYLADAADGAKRLDGLAFEPEPAKVLHLARAFDGTYRARDLSPPLERRVSLAKGEITESLYADAIREGVHDQTIAEIANLLAYTVDFQREIHPGDRFEILYEEWLTPDGRSVKSGDLYYVGFTPSGRQLDYWRFQPDAKAEIGFYDLKGESAKRFLMKTPINGARLSSGFGSRKHPILGYTRLHKGTDFAAPRGTPVFAAGEGVIKRANRYGSFGNYILIRHANGYETAYAHLNGFARGIRAGVRVKQGQVIGYVGTTGRSTGPHLHYEVHKNGVAVNPMRIKAPTGRTLTTAEKIDFDVERALIDAMRAQADEKRPEPEPALIAETPNEAAPPG